MTGYESKKAAARDKLVPNNETLVKRLRDTASRGVSVWGDLMLEAADALEQPTHESDELNIAYMTGLYDGKKAVQLAPSAYAVIEMRVGDARIRHYLTQRQLHDATDPWLLMELCAKRCIRDLKESTND
jgi:hypothetical protein